VPVRPDRLVVPVQPGGNYPDIEPVKKHSDVQRAARYAVSRPFTKEHSRACGVEGGGAPVAGCHQLDLWSLALA
jgi:hypothetical protein